MQFASFSLLVSLLSIRDSQHARLTAAMHFSLKAILAVASLTTTVVGQDDTSGLVEYTIQAENITAKLIGYGARLTSLLVNDRDGNQQDIALGYDDPAQYPVDTETNHTYFGEYFSV